MTAPESLPSDARRAWADRIDAAWRATIDGILAVGRLLSEAKAQLPHGEFEAMIERDLPFKPSTAQRLMKIAADERLSNPAHVQLLPPHWGTLYELTKLSNEEFATKIATGQIHPELERRDVVMADLRQRRAQREAELGARQRFMDVHGLVQSGHFPTLGNFDLSALYLIARRRRRCWLARSPPSKESRSSTPRGERIVQELEESDMRGDGNGEARSEAQEAVRDSTTVVDLFERARGKGAGRGDSAGGRGGDGGGGDSGGDDDGEDIGPFGRLLLSSLRQMAELQMRTAESTVAGVAEVAVRLADQAARGDEVWAKGLSETILRSLSANADLAEKTADAFERLAGRVAALERQVAGQRSSK